MQRFAIIARRLSRLLQLALIAAKLAAIMTYCDTIAINWYPIYFTVPVYCSNVWCLNCCIYIIHLHHAFGLSRLDSCAHVGGKQHLLIAKDCKSTLARLSPRNHIIVTTKHRQNDCLLRPRSQHLRHSNAKSFPWFSIAWSSPLLSLQRDNMCYRVVLQEVP